MMKKLTQMALVALASIAITGISQAQDAEKAADRPAPKGGGDKPAALGAKRLAQLEKTFARLDADSDKKLTEGEFIANKRWKDKEEAGKKAFARMDKDKNASLSFEEMKKGAVRSAANAKRKAAGNAAGADKKKKRAARKAAAKKK